MNKQINVPWTLASYAQRCIRSNWTQMTKGDLETSEALALAIDKFAKDWVAANCPGRENIREQKRDVSASTGKDSA